jgi:hypothetical protein
MPNHGRRQAASEYEDEPVRRFGFLTMETALVLGLAVLIAIGSVLVHVALPSKRQNETVIGDQKVRITTVGKGGVLPGPVEPRNIPIVVPTGAATTAPRPHKPKPITGTATPTPVPSPTPTKGGGGPIITPPAGGGGGGHCTVLILCKPGQKPSATPVPQPATAPAQPPGPQSAQPQ